MLALIRHLLLLWLALLAALLLSQRLAPSLNYGLMLALALGCPVVAGLLLWWAVLELRQAWHRVRVLRRAAKWPRLRRERYAQGDEWWKEES